MIEQKRVGGGGGRLQIPGLRGRRSQREESPVLEILGGYRFEVEQRRGLLEITAGVGGQTQPNPGVATRRSGGRDRRGVQLARPEGLGLGQGAASVTRSASRARSDGLARPDEHGQADQAAEQPAGQALSLARPVHSATL